MSRRPTAPPSGSATSSPAGRRGRGSGAGARPGRAPAARRRLRADLHLGHRGGPQGHHAHRADGQLQRPGGGTRTWGSATRTSCGCRRRSGTRPASTTACASPCTTACRWCSRTAGTPAVACELIAARGASYTLASTTFLQDLVAEAERRGDRRLGSMTRFGCGGAPVPPELVRRAAALRASGCSGSTGRPRCSSPPGTGPAARRDKAVDTDGPALEPRRGRGPRRGRARSAAGRRRGDPRAGAQHLRRVLPRPGAHGRHLRARRLDALRRPRRPWTTTAI